MKNTRTTTAKTAIINLIESTEVALSHSDIQSNLGDLCNRVTIYRVLDRLQEEGTIHKVVDVDGVAKFLACQQCEDSKDHRHDHHHVHFSCSECGNITCLHHVVPKFQLPNNYKMTEVNCTVRGICPNCG